MLVLSRILFVCKVILLLLNTFIYSVDISDEELSIILRMALLSSNKGDVSKSILYYKDVIAKADEEYQSKILSHALFELSKIYEYDTSTADEAFDYLVQAADYGHAGAMHQLGSIYATGLYTKLAPKNDGRAIILTYMASLAGDSQANMAMGFRYMYGIGVPESCEKALQHYEFSANVAADQISKRTYQIYAERSHLSNLQESSAKGKREFDPEVIDYYTFLANEGEVNAAITLGNLHLQGTRYIDQDLSKAAQYLRIASDSGNAIASGILGYLLAQSHPSDLGQDINISSVKALLQYAANRGDPSGIVGLGYLHYEGIGTEKDYVKAMEYFNRVSSKHMDAGFYMGEILMGLGKNDPNNLSKVFHTSKTQPLADENPDHKHSSHYKEALLELEERNRHDSLSTSPAYVIPTVHTDVSAAAQAYAVSSARGHPIALHRLAHMTAKGIGVAKHCQTAVTGFKNVAERGDWMSGLTAAHREFNEGNIFKAALIFGKFAIIGVETAQSNAAFLLSKVPCPSWLSPPSHTIDSNNAIKSNYPSHNDLINDGVIVAHMSMNEWVEYTNLTNETKSQAELVALASNRSSKKSDCESISLSFYGLSASQSNSESYLRIGDFYYYGKAGLLEDKLKASRFYQLAADLRNTHAIFNLGIMFEIGDGVDQDFHLAKRFYDQAAEFDSEANLPHKLALYLLQFHLLVDTYLGNELTSKIFIGLPTFKSFHSTIVMQIFPILEQNLPTSVYELIKSNFIIFEKSFDKMSSWINDGKIITNNNKSDGKIFKLWVYLSDFINYSMSGMDKYNANNNQDSIIILALIISFLYLHGWRTDRNRRLLQRRNFQ